MKSIASSLATVAVALSTATSMSARAETLRVAGATGRIGRVRHDLAPLATH